MDWKSIVKMTLAIALPVIYSIIKAKNPDLPITESDFIELIVWIVGSAIGGYQAKAFMVKK